jgi:ubiquinone/menaquinone biosynthesis C-methylase UbiE
MLALARRSASQHSHTNVSFDKPDITSIPLADGIADCIISDCVTNFVPENTKPLVFKKVFRLEKIDGRIGVSDPLALKEPA